MHVNIIGQTHVNGAVQARWDASHIRRPPCDYRDAGKEPRGYLSAVFLSGTSGKYGKN